MDDTEQKAIDALRAAGLEAEACAVEQLRAIHRLTMGAYEAGQRASFKAGQDAERARWEGPREIIVGGGYYSIRFLRDGHCEVVFAGPVCRRPS